MQALVVLTFLSGYLDAFQIFALGTLGITLSYLIRAVVLIVFFKKTIWDGECMQFSASPPLKFMLLFVGAAALSSLSPLLHTSEAMITQFLKTFSHLSFLVSFALIASIYPIKLETWERVFKNWLLISILVNVFAVYQIFARIYNLPFAWIEYSNISMHSRLNVESGTSIGQLSLQFGNFYRATSFFSEPSALAAYNVIVLALILFPKLQGNGFIFKKIWLNWTVIILSLIATFLTFSLSGLLGLFMGLALVLASRMHKVLKPMIFWTIVGATIIVIADRIVYPYYNISVLELFYNRIMGILQGGGEGMSGESFFTRAQSGLVGVTIWLSSPLFGYGLGCFYLFPGNETKFSDIGIASVLAETGILGVIAYTGFFISLFYFTYKYTEKGNSRLPFPQREKRVIGVLIFLVLIIFQVNFITSNQVVSSGTWVQIAPVMSLLNYTLFKLGYKRRELRLVNTPLKERVARALAAFRESQ